MITLKSVKDRCKFIFGHCAFNRNGVRSLTVTIDTDVPSIERLTELFKDYPVDRIKVVWNHQFRLYFKQDSVTDKLNS